MSHYRHTLDELAELADEAVSWFASNPEENTALYIVGPSGSGKSRLADMIEQKRPGTDVVHEEPIQRRIKPCVPTVICVYTQPRVVFFHGKIYL